MIRLALMIIMTVSFAEDAIASFLPYYRKEFPEASTTVKLHMLEDHLVPFLRGGREWVLVSCLNKVLNPYTESSTPCQGDLITCQMPSKGLNVS